MRILIILSISLTLSSCSAMLGFFFGIKEMKEETREQQVAYLDKHGIDTLYLYQLRDEYLDTLKQGGHALDTFTKLGFSPIQFRVYDAKTGKIVSGWASCYGNPDRIQLYEKFPPNRIPYLNTNLTLAADLRMVETFESQPLQAAELSKQYHYIILAYWGSYLGRINRDMLTALDSYVKKHTDKKVLLLKVNLGNS